jgi:hypothetical protein
MRLHFYNRLQRRGCHFDIHEPDARHQVIGVWYRQLSVIYIAEKGYEIQEDSVPAEWRAKCVSVPACDQGTNSEKTVRMRTFFEILRPFPRIQELNAVATHDLQPQLGDSRLRSPRSHEQGCRPHPDCRRMICRNGRIEAGGF